MFIITKARGFHLKFSNGWTVSVQFGPGNYCDNYHLDFDEYSTSGPLHKTVPPSATAEVAAWDKDGNWHKFAGSGSITDEPQLDKLKESHPEDRWLYVRDIYPRATSNEVAQFISLIAGKK